MLFPVKPFLCYLYYQFHNFSKHSLVAQKRVRFTQRGFLSTLLNSEISTHGRCTVCQCRRSWSSRRCSSPTAGYKCPCWHRSPPDMWCWDLWKSSHPHNNTQTHTPIHTHTHPNRQTQYWV